MSYGRGGNRTIKYPHVENVRLDNKAKDYIMWKMQQYKTDKSEAFRRIIHVAAANDVDYQRIQRLKIVGG